MTAPPGVGTPGERPRPLKFRTTTDLPAVKGTTLKVRGMLTVRWDGDVARTVMVARLDDGTMIEVDLLPVP